ncbi:MAG: helix-turn-helix transcriptional regulator [Bacteroidota bacterium]
MSKTVGKPGDKAYPKALNTIGDYLKSKRLDLGLEGIEVANLLKVHPQTITNWELNHSQPSIEHLPRIIDFIGYDPFEIQGDSIQALILNYQRRVGVGLPTLARRIGIDPGTLIRVSKGEQQPFKKTEQKIRAYISEGTYPSFNKLLTPNIPTI